MKKILAFLVCVGSIALAGVITWVLHLPMGAASLVGIVLGFSGAFLAYYIIEEW